MRDFIHTRSAVLTAICILAAGLILIAEATIKALASLLQPMLVRLTHTPPRGSVCL